MAVTQKLVTSNFNVHSAISFINSFANNDYFVFAGKHTPYANSDSIIETPTNSVKNKEIDIYNDMIFAKRVSSADVAHVIPKYVWTSNTYYNMYDHEDPTLLDKMFYTVVDDDTEYNVYKCLFNNSNASITTRSTVAPSRVGTSADLNPIETGDGYVWKYMYTVSKTYYDKFATSQYIPVIANTDVIANATKGTVEVIEIVSPGAGYNNHIASGVFKTADIIVGGVNTVYGAPEDAVAINDYYQGCVLKVTSGPAIGEYRRVLNYVGVGGQKTFLLDKAFNNAPEAGDEYELYPYVFVWGDGEESTPAEAMAYIDSSSSNSISRIEMLNVGQGYRYSEAYVSDMPDAIPITINSVYIPIPEVIQTDPLYVEAKLRPILSPKNGHGADPWNELGANRVCISTKYTQSEGGTIPVENDFRQIGLLKNPLYTNVDLILESGSLAGPGFSVGERVYQFRQMKLHGNVTVSSSNTTIIKTDYGVLSNTAVIVNGGTGYDNTDIIIFSGGGGTGANATINTNASGVITGVSFSNTGANYTSVPIAQIANSSGGSSNGANGSITLALKNPQTPTFKDSFKAGDYVLVNSGTNNSLRVVTNVPEDYKITVSNNNSFSANNAEVSALILEASGVVTSYNAVGLGGQITLSNVAGVFTTGSRIVGVGGKVGATTIAASGSTAKIDSTAIQVNDKNAGGFTTAVQLTRLVGNFTSGSVPFLEDELITQNSLISYAKPRGYVHHIELTGGTDDDVLYISDKFGIFNLDPTGVREIVGSTSAATLDNLLNKYPGDFVVGSGELLYYENLDPIVRNDNKSEIIKIILEF